MKSFRFDRGEASSYRYTPKASPVRVELARPIPAGQAVVVRLTYDGTIDPDPWLTNVVTPEWTELASYAAWYPQDPGSTAYTYTLRVKTEAGYAVAGSAPVSRDGDTWVSKRERPGWDMVLVAARGLRTSPVDATAYSSLLLVRSWYGRDTFTSTLRGYENEAMAAPAIWGLDRNDEKRDSRPAAAYSGARTERPEMNEGRDPRGRGRRHPRPRRAPRSIAVIAANP